MEFGSTLGSRVEHFVGGWSEESPLPAIWQAAMVTSVSSEGGLPHNLDAERAVLGAVLLDPRTLLTLQDLIRPEHFFSAAHRAIFQSMLAMSEDNEPVDPTTLAERLRRHQQLESIGGPAYLSTLEAYVFTTENVPQYARTIVDQFRLRQLIETSDEIIQKALSSPQPVEEILGESEKKIFDLTQESESRDFVHVEDIASETMDEITERFHNRRAVAGLPTGFSHLDELTAGLHPSELIILAARPSMGKTSLALNFATNIVVKSGVPVGFFSLEMSNQALVQRVMCSMARVSMQKARKGRLSRVELEKLDEQARRLSSAPLYIDDTFGMSILEVRAKARRLKARVKDLGLIILDYLQLMHGSGRSESRQQEVSEISRSLKALARELDVPIIALSQLSRGIEQRKGKDKEPKLSDLRESGAIEQDADVVMFVHRERRIEEAEGEDGPDPNALEEAEVIIGKQRNGPIGKVKMLYLGAFTRFETLRPDSGI